VSTGEEALPQTEGAPAAQSEPSAPVGLGARLRRVVAGFEKWAVVVILLVMAIVPVLESFARWIFKGGIPGAVLYTQHLTLWIGFLGALLATGTGKHLSLATGELIKGRAAIVARLCTGAMSAAVCALLAYASFQMVKVDSALVRNLPGGIPEWWSEVVMPVAFGLMAIRFAWKASDRWWGRLIAFAIAVSAYGLSLLEDHAESLLVPGAVIIIAGVVLGAPLFIGLSGLAMLLFFGDGTPIASVPTETFRLVASSSLPAIPLLTAAGFVLAEGGASKRLLRFFKAIVGWLPGGLALMMVVMLAGFTTFTGGSGVTILALGGLVLPMLIEEKYPEGFSLGLVTSGGSLGLLFPPSLPVILYAVVAGASVEDLFIAGLLPGLLLVLMVGAVGVFVGIKQKASRQPFSLREALSSFWAAKWELAIPTLVIAAIFTGFATMVEAAAMGLVAAIVSQSFLFHDLHWRKQLPDTLARGATLVGAVVILLGVAMGLTSYLVDAEIPAVVLEWTKAHIQSPVVFLLALNGVLLVLGSVLEIYSAIAILAPLLAPIGAAYGIDPLHMGIVFLANLELGFLFPPVGLNLILSSTRFNQPLARLYKVALPFLVIMALGVLAVTYVPAMTTGFLGWVRH
jgi:tripartite ATP-independent transporter DctM subunit